MNAELRADAECIAHFLSGHLTDAGVGDPDEGRVLEHSYTTDFFAWLCALLYEQGFGDHWLDRAIRSCQAALDCIADWTRHSPHLNRLNFHWEFKNLALLNVEYLIGDRLPKPLAGRLRQTLLNWHDLNIDSANWTAMRMLAYEMRYIRFRHAADRWRSQLELKLVLTMQTPEGFFPDTPHSHSMQYHAYVLSLLALYHRLTNDTRVRNALLRGIRFVADFINPAGDFNYYGRGQRQLFGYASMILALREAGRLCDHPAEAGRYYSLCERILLFVRERRGPDGVFPLVLNHSNEHWGWYDYNRPGDYLAFCGVWFLLAATVLEKKSAVSYEKQVYTRCYPELGLAVAARPDWFAAFSAGGDDLSEPVGLIHLWPDGPDCLGGPEPARAMGIDYQWNYFGPLVDERPVLQRQRGKMSADSSAIRISFSLPELKINQTYSWNGGLSFEQSVVAKHDLALVAPLFIAGASRPPSNLRLQALGLGPSPAGLVTQFMTDAFQVADPFTVRAKLTGDEVLHQEVHTVQIVHGRGSARRRIWGRILKAIWVIWVELIRS